MEKIDNLTLDDVLELIMDFPLEPRHRDVIITVNSYEPDGNLVLSDNMFSETQFVLSVGSHVHDLVPGQKVMLDVERMLKMVPVEGNSHEVQPQLQLRTVEVNDKVFAIVPDSYITCIDKR